MTPIHHPESNRILITILCCALILAAACARAGGKDYFPLADGSSWEYVGQASSSAGGRQVNIRATARVDGETLIEGKRYFKHVLTSDFSGVPEVGKVVEYVRFYRVADDGVYFRLDDDPDRPELLEMPLPIPIGTKWLSGSTEVQAERAGTVNVGGRGYKDCLKITFRQPDGRRTTENYLAPAVGIIKTVYVNSTEPKSSIEVTLENYKL
jgi:hypothetical protein